MLRYEILILTVPEITEDETKKVESDIDSIIDKSKGTVISYDRWGKYKLAYPVKHNEYGVYFLVRFKVNPENLHSLLANLHEYFAVKETELIMRHMITKLAPNESLEYKRPESLEETPGDIDNFLKDNKINDESDSNDDLEDNIEISETIEQ